MPVRRHSINKLHFVCHNHLARCWQIPSAKWKMYCPASGIIAFSCPNAELRNGCKYGGPALPFPRYISILSASKFFPRNSKFQRVRSSALLRARAHSAFFAKSFSIIPSHNTTKCFCHYFRMLFFGAVCALCFGKQKRISFSVLSLHSIIIFRFVIYN